MSDTATRLQTALAGRYRIERELGAGGMATVYLAHDIRHDRKVALKVLRPELAAVIGAERFLAEIKTTANLQHPHILPLHDSGEADSFLYYVMPFVEGESLRDRLSREKQLPVDDAIRIATQVASALDYAHRHGVIHRDIKPENILLHDGSALVADFGIALAMSTAGGSRMTETGMSLGTPHYMSPEQAMGEREITARSDVYALGAVTYEMLTGDPPFTGSTAQAVVARVVTEAPRPLRAQRHTIPPHVENAVLTALEKLPADRHASAAQFSEALTNPALTGARSAAAAGRRTGWRERAAPLVVPLAVLALIAVAVAVWALTRTPAPQVNRFALAFGADQAMSAPGGLRLAFAPDGRSFVYVGAGESGGRLWIRRMDQLQAEPITGSEGATSPVYSPDGGQLAFLTLNPFALKLIPSRGGPATTVESSNMSGGGVDWAKDGYLYFDAATSLSRIRPDGSGREVVYALDSTRQEAGVAWPQVLPGSRGVIFRLRHTGEVAGQYNIMVVDLKTGVAKQLVRAVFARYVPTGHLLIVTASGDLLAAPFDLGRLALTGPAVPLWSGLGVGGFGAVDLAVSSRGDLLYSLGGSRVMTEVVWVGRDGTSTPVDPAWQGDLIQSIALSPDGTRLATHTISASGSRSYAEDIWMKALDTGPLTRITFEGPQNRSPVWSPDGRSILFTSTRGVQAALYRKRADGSGGADELVRYRGGPLAQGFASPDGEWYVLQTLGGDILGFRPGRDTAPVPLIATSFVETQPALSPDGRWLAYVSDETGRNEVYVRPFPAVDSARWQVSITGGVGPRWAHSGKELFYRNDVDDMMAAEVRTAPQFAIGSQHRLFTAAPYLRSSSFTMYDVAPDDRRFIMLHAGPTSAEGAATGLVLVQNFLDELKRSSAE
ncbi:MAG: protein kinase [Gemmatimonadales bacterium]